MAGVGAAKPSSPMPPRPDRIKWWNQRTESRRAAPPGRTARTSLPRAGRWSETPPMFVPVLAEWTDPVNLVLYGAVALVSVLALIELCGLRVIPNDQVGIV